MGMQHRRDLKLAGPRGFVTAQRRGRQRSHAAIALALWHEAEPITGTLAERYLAETREHQPWPCCQPTSRCVFIRDARSGPAQRLPCLIALYQDVASDAPGRHSPHRA